MPKWMWYPGDFELYHAMLVHNRREKHGMYCSPMWRIDPPHRNVRLYKIAELSEPETFFVKSNGAATEVVINGKRYCPETDITLEKGRNFIKLSAFKDGGFPCIWCDGKTFSSDGSWTLASFGEGDIPAGTNDMYDSPDDNPEVFRFSYERIKPVASEKVSGGTLYDFGREVMGKLVLDIITKPGEKALVVYGESREEALDPERAELTENIVLPEKSLVLRSRACRYVFITENAASYEVSYDFEYLPIEAKGCFSCGDKLINKIWEISAYTLSLNTREAFFDGIKRDRWIWAGDAYQSFFVNYYYAGDSDTVRRTLLMLRGAGEMPMHINIIVDYSLYWLISIWDYYYYSGDIDFVKLIYPKTKAIWELINDRLDENGFIVGDRKKGDWTFIDWAQFDGDGAVCAEQMLLFRAYEAFAKCTELLGGTVTAYADKAASLKEKINDFYWDGEKEAYIDSFSSGKRNVTRHANIFALLFGVADETRREKIIKSVIGSKTVPAITTPYFEFFELDAMCGIGDFSYVTDMLRSYWGGMVSLGATTFWEEYKPDCKGAEHYAMYGSAYGKSLCHAWSASPIYLLGKYALGVRPTSPAYRTFDIVPNTLGLDKISGRVPVLDGYVDIIATDDEVTVFTDRDGGTLVIGEKRRRVPKGEMFIVKR